MRLPGRVRDHRRRQRKHQPLRGEQVDQRNDPALREHRERKQQEDGREEIDQLLADRERRHDQLPSSRLTSIPSTASRKAVPRNSGARKMRIFAESVSITASDAPPIASFRTSAGAAPSIATKSAPSAMPNGKN